jgi:ribosomal protein L24E
MGKRKPYKCSYCGRLIKPNEGRASRHAIRGDKRRILFFHRRCWYCDVEPPTIVNKIWLSGGG